MINAISTALSGLAAASRKVEHAAARIAAAADPAAQIDLAEEIVTIKLAESAFKANIATLKTSESLSDELFRAFDKKI